MARLTTPAERPPAIPADETDPALRHLVQNPEIATTEAIADLERRALSYLGAGYPLHLRGPAGSGRRNENSKSQTRKAASPWATVSRTVKRGASTCTNMCSKMRAIAGTPRTSLNGSLKQASAAYSSPSPAMSDAEIDS